MRNKRAKVRRIKRRKQSEKAKDGEKERQSNQNPGLETQSKKMAPSPLLPSPSFPLAPGYSLLEGPVEILSKWNCLL